MRRRRHRPGPAGRGSRKAVVTAAAVLAGVVGLSGCDAVGGDEPAPFSASDKAKPKRLWDRSPRSMAAIGDSITRAFDACSVLSDCPEASWATGSDATVRSLAVRLLGRTGAERRSWNYARTGARMVDLPEQMRQAAAHKPGLVTVLAGANDACRSSVAAMTPVEDFRADFEQAMRTLRRTSPTSQVYVASVPDLKRLWEAGRGNALGKEVWKLGICPSMLKDSDALDSKSQARRDRVREQVVRYNTALKEVCAKDLRCRYDGGAVFGYRFDDTQLSTWDWFHPSKDGQSRLAEIAYRKVTSRTPPAS
ncbi:SGNH/GDSL hydrolase family protein [Streptomyces uncialis]|uniref:Lipoprotein n=1 Tax=Streptomyces uncialis TaxID=1048205 RepID=A0A1Q4UZ83_9ACTN|nr:SGNH/GDSL hydrolase family protein [Streptomyces uncialis]OKH90885.1 lipoprotein [Streptomyces uncialis]WTE10681.1 SGNH/GDSL hydrolase family protein [Streptomyces uncialis]